jgi:hypothetical protein
MRLNLLWAAAALGAAVLNSLPASVALGIAQRHWR